MTTDGTNDLVFASDLSAGDWIAQRSGTYLVDDVETVFSGLTYIGTCRGVLVLKASSPVLRVGVKP